MKKALSLILIISVLFSFVSFNAFANDNDIKNAKEVFEATEESIVFRRDTDDDDYSQEKWLKFTPTNNSIYRFRLENQHSSSARFNSKLDVYDPTDEWNEDFCFMYSSGDIYLNYDEDLSETDIFLKEGIPYYIKIETEINDINRNVGLTLSINSIDTNFQLGQVLSHTFNVTHDGSYEYGSEYDYFFKPEKNAYYSFTATLVTKFPNTTLVKSITEGLELCILDTFDNDSVSSNEYWSVKDNSTTTTAYLIAGRQYRINLNCWKSGIYTIDLSSTFHTTHSFKSTYYDKATVNYNGIAYQECIYCEKERTVSIPKINSKSIKLSATAFYYDGKVKTPTVIVKDVNGTTLKNNTDYTLTYTSGRKTVGTYKVKISFKGKYSGTYYLSFKIIPKGTTISKVTAGKKAFVAQWKKQATQTTGYQLQYSTNAKFTGAKTVTIKSPKTLKSTVKNLSAKKVYYVRIRTYKTVSKVNYFSGWSKAVKVKTK